MAINDGIVLESCIYRILQKHFRGTPYYTQLLELFHEVLCRWEKTRQQKPYVSGRWCALGGMFLSVQSVVSHGGCHAAMTASMQRLCRCC